VPVTTLKIGYLRVFTDDQDLTTQRDVLAALGVDPKRIYVDYARPEPIATGRAAQDDDRLPRRRHPGGQARPARPLGA